MFLIPTFVAPSSIHGLGVFACEPIARGAVIWRHEPGFDIVLSHEHIARLPPEGKRFVEMYCYESPLAPGGLVLNGDNARYLNHSRSPNTDNADPSLARALRDITKGEEITCDYGVCCLEFGGAVPFEG